jgi:ABC-type nitrate/sulfonate/bicarbonate transport system ATPase subunit
MGLRALENVTQLEKEVAELIELIHLEGFEHHYPHQLSGGMRQRVELARVLAGDSDILLMDEPFSALDYQTRLRMRAELVTLLKKRRRTVVFVTHDIEEALFLSDRIVVLNNGPASTIREIVEVHLPRPRNKIEIVKMPEYITLRDKLLHLLTDKFSIEDMGMKYKN